MIDLLLFLVCNPLTMMVVITIALARMTDDQEDER